MDKQYSEIYDDLPEEAKDAMYELYMKGINHDGHSWVTFGQVETAVGKLVKAIFKEQQK